MDDKGDEVRKFRDLYRKQNNVEIANGQVMRVLTYNMGLLWGKTASVPNYNERRAKILSYFVRSINQAGADKPQVIFLQELWYGQDAKSLQQGLSLLGYEPALSEAADNNHGLQIFVERSFMNPNTRLRNVRFEQFNAYGTLEYTAGYLRGHLTAEMTAVSGDTIFLCAAHLSAGLGLTEFRIQQAQELAQMLNKRADDFDFVIAGADFNASPTFSKPLPEEQAQWTRNIQAYLDFANVAYRFRDAYWSVNQDDGFTQDRVKNPLTKYSDSTKDEPEQRIDYVWFGSAKKTFRVETASLYFTDFLKDQNGRVITGTDPRDPSTSFNLHMSDHFGVFSKVRYQN